MSVFTDQLGLAQNGDFVRRVQMAAVKAAIAVQAEDVATANHAERSAWAYQVLHGPEGVAPKIAMAAATSVVLTIDSPDADIEFTVNAMWNAFALGGA